MEAKWYIITYHDVSWEDSLLTRSVVGTISPDLFRLHLETFRRNGELISIQEGFERINSGVPFRKPAFSIWFDDGFSGVTKYALPICKAFGITAAMAVCSRFVLRQEMFWRAKLAYIKHVDGIRILRTRLRKLGYDPKGNLRSWTMDHFSSELLDLISQLYNDLSNETFRRDAWRIFNDIEGIKKLSDAGWLVANHSAAHYPMTDGQSKEFIRQQFQECDELFSSLGQKNKYYVIPFEHSRNGVSTDFYLNLELKGLIVRVGNLPNSADTLQKKVVYRYSPVTDIRHFKKTPICALQRRSKIDRLFSFFRFL